MVHSVWGAPYFYCYTESLSLPITTRARVTHSGIVDVKLKQLFDFEKRRIKFIEFVRNIAIFVQ